MIRQTEKGIFTLRNVLATSKLTYPCVHSKASIPTILHKKFTDLALSSTVTMRNRCNWHEQHILKNAMCSGVYAGCLITKMFSFQNSVWKLPGAYQNQRTNGFTTSQRYFCQLYPSMPTKQLYSTGQLNINRTAHSKRKKRFIPISRTKRNIRNYTRLNKSDTTERALITEDNLDESPYLPMDAGISEQQILLAAKSVKSIQCIVYVPALCVDEINLQMRSLNLDREDILAELRCNRHLKHLKIHFDFDEPFDFNDDYNDN